MNENFDSSDRSSTELFFFGMACLGVFVSIGGLMAASIPAVTVGGFFLAVSVAYFFLRQ